MLQHSCGEEIQLVVCLEIEFCYLITYSGLMLSSSFPYQVWDVRIEHVCNEEHVHALFVVTDVLCCWCGHKYAQDVFSTPVNTLSCACVPDVLSNVHVN